MSMSGKFNKKKLKLKNPKMLLTIIVMYTYCRYFLITILKANKIEN